MKNSKLFLIVLFAFIAVSCNKPDKSGTITKDSQGRVTISGAFALFPMAQKWREEYNRTYPNIQIDISAGGAGKGMADALSGIIDLGMVSREISKAEEEKGAWYIPVAKDAVIGVINVKNPVINEINAKGLTSEMIKKIFITKEFKTWGDVIGDPSKSSAPIIVYSRSDACGAADIWAKYLGKKQEDLLGIGVFGDPGIAQAVQNDINGIGYNNIGFAFNAKSKKMNDFLSALPLDINKNGKLDSEEKIYDSQDAIVEAIAKNIYPSPPSRDLYFVSKGKPVNPFALHFINWIMTEGQKYVKENGYIEITKEKTIEAFKKIK